MEMIGNIAAIPIRRCSPSGVDELEIRLAVHNPSPDGEEETVFHRCMTHGRPAFELWRALHKGDLFRIKDGVYHASTPLLKGEPEYVRNEHYYEFTDYELLNPVEKERASAHHKMKLILDALTEQPSLYFKVDDLNGFIFELNQWGERLNRRSAEHEMATGQKYMMTQEETEINEKIAELYNFLTQHNKAADNRQQQ